MTSYQDELSDTITLFIVTGVSFSLFALTLNRIDGQDIQLFWWISRISFLVGSTLGLLLLLNKTKQNNKVKL